MNRETEAAAAVACPNCGAALVGPYCAQCGQKAAHRIVSIRRIIIDALQDQLQLDAALPRTVITLIAHPGLLTREYIAGRVMRYIPPIRLYLAASVLFFLVFALVPDQRMVKVSSSVDTDSVPAQSAGGIRVNTVAPPSQRKMSEGLPSWAKPTVERFSQQLERLKRMNPRDRSRAMAAGFANTAPKVIFLMLPVFAAILKLLYIRRHRLYVEHAVFALHVHALAFIAFTPLLFLRSATWVAAAVDLWLAFYLFHAMRVVYGQGRGRTAVKFVLLGISYLFVTGIGMAIAAVTAIMAL